MKSKFLGVSLGSALFIFLTIAVLALVRPVYLRLSEKALEFEKSLCLTLEEKTGLSLSYKSLSPSIFVSANFKGIRLSDVESKKVVFSIKKASLSYSVTKFFSGNPILALNTLSLNGVTVEYDAVKDSSFIEKIKKLVDSEKKETETKNSDEKSDEIQLQDSSAFTLKGKSFNIPLDVVVKNLSLHYSDKDNDVLVALKSLSFRDFFRAEGVSVKTAGTVRVTSSLIAGGNSKRGSAACGFSISGNLFPDFNGSSALVSLSSLGGADYTISHLDMLLNYNDEKVELRTMRTVLPFSLFASVDFQKESLSLQSEFDRFDPFRLITIRQKSELMQKVSGSRLSGKLSGILTKNNVTYSSNLNVDVSKKLLGQDVQISLKFNGDKNYVNISKIAANGDFIDAEFTGGFNIARLQPSGTFNLNYLQLQNGGIISTEVYVDPTGSGYMCFAPQIFMNEKSFTAVQFSVFPGRSSVDFSFEFYDYAHADYESSGHFKMDGSFLTGKEHYLQAGVSVSDLFIDSILETAAFFTDEAHAQLLKSASKMASPYVFNTEAYISSDFEDFSINAPACLLANTQKDRELLIFAADGSKETVNITQFDLQFGSIEAHAQTSVDFSDSFRDFSFVSDLIVNSIPYRFNGNVTPEWVSVSGDYDFDAIISIGTELFGNVSARQFPVAAGKNVFAFSFDTNFSWNMDEGPAAEIISFEASEPSNNIAISPRLAFSGSANRYGFVFNTFAYSDTVSNIDGSGNAVWNVNDGIFDSISITLDGKNPVSAESISFTADITNPSRLEFSSEALMNDFYMSIAASIHNFPAARFMENQGEQNSISAEITATGTVSNPFVSVILQRAYLSLYGYPLSASASVVYDDTGLRVSDVNCSWSVARITGFEAFYNASDMQGKASTRLEIFSGKDSISVPLTLSLTCAGKKEKNMLPEFITAEIKSEKVSGGFIKQSFPVKVSLVKTPDRIEVMTQDGKNFSASLENNNKILASADNEIFKFNADGIIEKNNLDVQIKGIRVDLGKISSMFEIPMIHFNYGILTGALKISGLTTDPEFTGAFNGEYPNILIPQLSKSSFSTDKIFMTVGRGGARVAPTRVYLGKGWGTVSMEMEMNRWLIDTILCKVHIDDEHKVPIEMAFPNFYVKGDGSCDLDILFTFPDLLEVTGKITGDKADVDIVANALQNQLLLEDMSAALPGNIQQNLFVSAKLDITVGQKVQVLFNPLLRGLVMPGTKLFIEIDGETGDFEVKSDLTLRGGEIAWLNRNFYMKEGHLTLNETKDRIDPRITVRAETRERDENGNMVTIILSAINESLSSFNPKFTSSPAKSEQEIMQILGQVVAADSEDFASLAVAGGDYLVQAKVMRRVENTLREMMNFDIFSIRTNVLQNSLKVTMNRNDDDNRITIGNFIDNSTVYIGKYFGSSMYVDTLLHWTYDQNKAEDGTYANAIVFQPEFGFEMTSPFVNIRLGVAPDIESIRKGDNGMWVPATSMTLSWKHSF